MDFRVPLGYLSTCKAVYLDLRSHIARALSYLSPDVQQRTTRSFVQSRMQQRVLIVLLSQFKKVVPANYNLINAEKHK